MERKEAVTLRRAAELHVEWLIDMTTRSVSRRSAIKCAYTTLAAWLSNELGREAMTSDWTPENIELYFRKRVAKLAAPDQKRSTTLVAERWLMQQGYIEWGPSVVEATVPQKGRTSKPRDRRLTDKELIQLLKAALARHPRNYYLCLFVRLSGRRIGEVTDLTWGDILWDEDDYIWNNFKAKRLEQRGALTPALRAVLSEWKTAYEGEIGCEVRSTWYVFPASQAAGKSYPGRRRPITIVPPCKIARYSDIIDEALGDSDLRRSKGDGWHILRKTVVNRVRQQSRAEDRGDSWDLAQGLADHATVAMTKVYVSDREDYEKLKEYLMTANLIDADAMAEIPTLATLAIPDTQKTPASEGANALINDQVDTSDDLRSNVRSLASFASRRRALG